MRRFFVRFFFHPYRPNFAYFRVAPMAAMLMDLIVLQMGCQRFISLLILF